MCAVHIFYIGYCNVYPAVPNVRVLKSDLNEMIFPITFKICMKEIKPDNTRFNKYGYLNEWSYFRGQSMFDEEKMGWAGHSINGTVLGSVEEVYSRTSLDFKNSMVFMRVITADGVTHIINGHDLKWPMMADYRGCKHIYLHQYLNMTKTSPLSILFSFTKQDNRLITVKPCDSKKALQRTLLSNHFDYKGPPIQIINLTSSVSKIFGLKVSKFIDSKFDPNAKCVDYPTREFKTYQDCDKDFVENEIKRKYDIMPFWASRSHKDVTTSK